MGNEEKDLQIGLEDAQLLTSSQPIYPQCHPPDLRGDRRQSSKSQGSCVSGWICQPPSRSNPSLGLQVSTPSSDSWTQRWPERQGLSSGLK